MNLVTRNLSETLEAVIVGGDLKSLTPQERVGYYNQVCTSLGLNPLTKPFSYITLNGKLTLYANRDCTDQLRELQNVSVTIPSRETIGGVYVVTAKATLTSGRTDESIGAVTIEGLKGDALANAFMKAETKAKRRVTLSIVGLGWLDETEIETIPDARPAVISETGEIVESPHPLTWGELGLRLEKEYGLKPLQAAQVMGYATVRELQAAAQPTQVYEAITALRSGDAATD